MQGVHFTILLTSPCAAEFYVIWHTSSTHRRNHLCQIFSQSVQGLRSSDTPKLPFPIDLLHHPYNSVCTDVRHCEKFISLFWKISRHGHNCSTGYCTVSTWAWVTYQWKGSNTFPNRHGSLCQWLYLNINSTKIIYTGLNIIAVT